jgi:hypothetical protein
LRAISVLPSLFSVFYFVIDLHDEHETQKNAPLRPALAVAPRPGGHRAGRISDNRRALATKPLRIGTEIDAVGLVNGADDTRVTCGTT